MLKKLKENELIKILSFMKKRTPLYMFCVILRNLITSICFNIVIAYIIKDVFDAALKGDTSLIFKATMIAATAYITGSILSPVVSYLSSKCVKETMQEIRINAFGKLEDLTIESLEKDHSGNYISIVTNDINNIEAIYNNQISSLVFAIIHGVISISSILFMEWRLAVVVIVLGIGTVIINNCFSHKLRYLNDTLQHQMGKTTERLIDLIQSSAITKMFHLKKWVLGHYAEENNKYLENSRELTRLEALFDSVNTLLSSVKYIGVLCLSIFMIYKHFISAGVAMAVMQLMGNADYMFQNIGTFVKDIQKSLASASRVMDLLSMDSEAESPDMPFKSGTVKNFSDSSDSVELDNVTFCYPKNETSAAPALSNININIKSGTTIALVGSSGSGKSTVAKLLLGFYHPQSGSISIEGMSTSECPASLIREKVSYVPQNPYLFCGTIKENIEYGKPGASEEEIISAAKAANAHDFIMNLPDGYDTSVGERGDNLSGGQKQRIAIARALIKGSPILLLDEATSALDSKSEHEITDTLAHIMKNRTVVIIAHKLSTIRNADIIYVMDKGKIVEQGNHEKLLSMDGLYKRLYEAQSHAGAELAG